MPRSSASGCRWRVSEKRRIRTSSRASRKKIERPDARAPRARPRIAPKASGDVAGAHVEDDRRPREPGRVRSTTSVGEVGSSSPGQVVDDEVAEILEQLRRGRLAAARETAEHDDTPCPSRRRTASTRCLLGDRPSAASVDARPPRRPTARPRPLSLPLRRMKKTVPSNRTYMRQAEDGRADEIAAGRDRGREDRDAEDDHPPCAGAAAARSRSRPATARRAGSGTP